MNKTVKTYEGRKLTLRGETNSQQEDNVFTMVSSEKTAGRWRGGGEAIWKDT